MKVRPEVYEAVRQEVAGLVLGCGPGRGLDPLANDNLAHIEEIDDGLCEEIDQAWREISGAIATLLGVEK